MHDLRKVSAPSHSRFFIAELESYKYEQFYEITPRLLDAHQEIARIVAHLGI
jgi:hypothetical protein